MTLTQKLNNEIARLRDELHNANLRADKAERLRNEDAEGWANKWRVAVDMAARAELERDDLRSIVAVEIESLGRMRIK